MEGKFISTSKGYGFIEIGEGMDDVFVPPSKTKCAMYGDIVEFELIEDEKSPRGKNRKYVAEVTKILKHNVRQVIGTLVIDRLRHAFVVPDNKAISTDIHINDYTGYEDKDKVVVDIVSYPRDPGFCPEGRIREKIGVHGEKFAELTSIIERYALRDEFPEKVLREALSVSQQDINEELEYRTDYRDHKVFTIDGDDAKDLDDAISIKREGNKYKLWVHIADVTHYVRENAKLDREALKRATSVYLVDKVLPMLPKELSNGACSLHPNTDKLTLTVEMLIDKKGEVKNYDIQESVINSCCRCTYDKVTRVLNGEDVPEYAHIYEDLKLAEELALVLNKKRVKRGSIDFDFPEDKIILTDDEEVKRVEPYPRTTANRIIEEFMLITNETVSEHFYWLELPFVYRVHEDPSEEKLQIFSNMLAAFNLTIKGDTENIRPKQLQQVLDQVKGRPEENAISMTLLRSLKQAKYMPHNVGHFGLAADYYSHWTSPIRRYPDLQIHRIAKEWIHGTLNDKRITHYKAILNDVCVQSSTMEREAEKAEDDVHAFYRAKYIQAHADEEFEAAVFNVSNNQITLMVDGIIKGKIDIEHMYDDYYELDNTGIQLIGQTTGRRIRIGDKMQVKLDHVDLRYEIYFVEVDNDIE